MDTLRAAVAVLRVAEAGSFAGAARLLGVTPAAVARLVGRFEAVHGAQLFRRTTRTLSLTPDGERFLAEVRSPALALAAAASRLGAKVGVAGTVRVTAAASLAPTLLQALAPLLERHPALRVELALDDQFADLGGGRWDLAVRIAPRIADAGLLARRPAKRPVNAGPSGCTVSSPPQGEAWVAELPDSRWVPPVWGPVCMSPKPKWRPRFSAARCSPGTRVRHWSAS